MIGYKKVVEIFTVSFLAFVLAACNTSTQLYDEEPDETGIKTKNQMPTIMTNDSKDSEKDEAYERLIKLQELNLSEIDVNMFKAYNNQLINDGCGLFRGRQILPFEHLSRFQNDLIG